MNMDSPLVWFLLILSADLVAAILTLSVEKIWKHLKQRQLDLNCDNSGCPTRGPAALKLSRTPDKKSFLCKACMEAYLSEHEGQFDAEAVAKARRGFRKIKRKRR